ncbi:hypothetical protein FDG2_2007 [Candidatus Protofrankia californiensis]|uniref:Uncharacterized protein n=1 Tax=Candidatus Protofrankia californiensis TaxID=1839754 RepID=A0A1C3NWN6_9ACTN|nr:hypothetical protein FDG2_2007 [Candidatus Protofrankia californiensis]
MAVRRRKHSLVKKITEVWRTSRSQGHGLAPIVLPRMIRAMLPDGEISAAVRRNTLRSSWMQRLAAGTPYNHMVMIL